MTVTRVDTDVFVGDGEMAERCRAFDWARTPLGPVAMWSQSLRTTVSMLLASRNPMFLFWGPEGVQIYNDAYRPSLGLGDRHPRALGAQARDFWTEIWEAIGPQIEGVMTRGESTWHEDQYLPIVRNGHLEDVWWTYGYSPVRDDDGSIGGTLVVCQETTPRVLAEHRLAEQHRESERAAAALAEAHARFRAVHDVSPDVSILAEAVRDDSGHISDFRFIYANEATHRILLARDEEIVGRTVREAFPESAGRIAHYARVVESGVMMLEDIHYARHAASLGLRVTVVKVGDGVHVNAVDLTARIQAAEEREQLLAAAERAREEAERANRAKSDFLAIVSHELRTPLSAIDGYAELMEMGVRGPLTAQQRHDLERIRRSQRHLLGLINGVLNYARVEGGTVQYNIEPVIVANVLSSCEELTGPQMRAKSLAFAIADCDPALRVLADIEKLEQILINLLTNAMKFTDGSGRISLSCSATDETITISVADTGRGIPANKVEQIFAPFVQVDAQLTRSTEGIGLGLAISRDLARAMGGNIIVESTLGVGSVFSLTLPRAQ